MGGYVALRLARRAPERILSLSTLATKMDWTEASCARESELLSPEKIEAKVPRYAARLSELHARNGWQQVVEETRSLITQMHQNRLEETLLRQIQQPVCVLLGDRDAMVSLEETIALYRALPNASLAVLPETSHPIDRVDLELLAGWVRRNMERRETQKR